MISAVLVFNNHGKPRVNQFYQHYVSFLRLLSLRGKNPSEPSHLKGKKYIFT